MGTDTTGDGAAPPPRTPRHALTVYAIRERVGGEAVTSLDQVVEPGLLKTPGVQVRDVPGASNFEARMYVYNGELGPPPWARYLDPVVKNIEWPYRRNVGGLLVVALKQPGATPDYFAVTFGPSGAYLLRNDAYKRGFGLRAALNILCAGLDPDGDGEGAKFQQLSSRRLNTVVLHSKKQSSRPAPFAAFGLDPQQDLLNGVVGAPTDARWGNRVSGAESVTVRTELDLNGVGVLCRRLATMAKREDYKRWFDWIDDIEEVSGEPWHRLAGLLMKQLGAADPGDLVLTVPEIIEWDRVDHFRLVAGDRQTDVDELRLSDYRDLLADGTGQRVPPDSAALERHRIVAVGAQGEEAYSWSVLKCLDGEIRAGSGQKQVAWFVSGGRFYEVAKGFLGRLNRELQLIGKSGLKLPEYRPGQEEKDYARSAASPDVLVLDRENVHISGRGSVEICDLMTTDGRLVYLKRMRENSFSSELLSHLFTQAAVAAELLKDGGEYRGRIAAKAREAEGKRAKETGDQTVIGRFSSEFSEGFTPHGREVVIGIIGPWQGHDLVTKLPFFSKLSLRKAAGLIRSMGYKVTYAPIESKALASRP